MRYGIAGAGLTGSIIARELADAGHQVVIHETRDHIAGNCHTARHRETGVMVHQYGPHIFHTDRPDVWQYVNRWADMVPFTLRVKATTRDEVMPLPVNLATINQIYRAAMNPKEAFARVQADLIPCAQPANFEEAALAAIGPTIYGRLFKGYTEKQWGRPAVELPASVFRRLPIRFTYDDNYFTHPWQAIPRDGYTAMVERIVDHPNIHIELQSPYPKDSHDYDHTVWTGPVDGWFDYQFGRLGYRTLNLLPVYHGDVFQGCPLMNYPDPDVPWTRITEHRFFAPWEKPSASIVTIESAREAEPDDEPFYPVRLAGDHQLLDRYQQAAAEQDDVTFAGRLGTYRYLDMDVTIAEALTTAHQLIKGTR